MNYILTQHARDAMAKRGVTVEWLERTLTCAQRIEPDSTDASLEHRLAVIPEHGNRVLRAIVNTAVNPFRIVTMFFDRKMKGKL
jgi:uncharacterized DUF497 family protein